MKDTRLERPARSSNAGSHGTWNIDEEFCHDSAAHEGAERLGKPMNSSTDSSQLRRRGLWIRRGRGLLSSIGLLALASAAQSAPVVSVADDFAQFNDLDGAFVVANGEARRSQHEGIYTEDRHYLTSTRSDYLSSDWIYEVTFRSPSNGPPDILFIGIGSGRPDPAYFNEPANSLEFRIHQGWIGGRVDVAAHPTGPQFAYFAEAIGYLPGRSSTEFTEFTARIAKVGNTIEFSICRCPSASVPCEPEFFDEILDISAAAPFLSVGNTYLFLGNGSGSYVFTKATITPASADDSSLGNGSAERVAESNGSSDALNQRGGGAMDALFLALLAQLAAAGALSRRGRRVP